MGKAKEGLAELHKEALDRFTLVQNVEGEQRKLAVKDMLFANAEDGQWEDEAIEKRKDKPRYTINRVAGALDQLVGDQRQNSVAIDIDPFRS